MKTIVQFCLRARNKRDEMEGDKQRVQRRTPRTLHKTTTLLTKQFAIVLGALMFIFLGPSTGLAVPVYAEQLSADGADVLIPGGGNTKIPDDQPANTEISAYCSYCSQKPLTANSTPGSSAGSGSNTPGQGF